MPAWSRPERRRGGRHQWQLDVFQQRLGCAGHCHRSGDECSIRYRSRRRGACARGNYLSMMRNITMIRLCKSSITALALILCAVAVPSAVWAQSTCNPNTATDLCPTGDTDIFMGNSSGNSDAPNIIFLIDNSPNWSRASQQWPDNSG